MQKVRVYYNLTKKVWSVMDKKTRKVIAHVPSLTLHNASFIVSQAGRNRVIREQKKYVHAYVDGLWDGNTATLTNWSARGAYYNPYKVETFIDTQTNEPLTEEYTMVSLDEYRQVWYQRA